MGYSKDGKYGIKEESLHHCTNIAGVNLKWNVPFIQIYSNYCFICPWKRAVYMVCAVNTSCSDENSYL